MKLTLEHRQLDDDDIVGSQDGWVQRVESSSCSQSVLGGDEVGGAFVHVADGRGLGGVVRGGGGGL